MSYLGLGHMLAKGARAQSFPVRAWSTESPLGWVEVELRADPTMASNGQLHSPTPPIYKTPLALPNPECSALPPRPFRLHFCSPLPLEVTHTTDIHGLKDFKRFLNILLRVGLDNQSVRAAGGTEALRALISSPSPVLSRHTPHSLPDLPPL